MKEIFINDDITIIQALEKLDKTGRGILLVQEEGRLLATVTDGDIRRWILKNGNLDVAISQVANYHPRFLFHYQEASAIENMKRLEIYAMPIVDQTMKILKVVFLNEDIQETPKFQESIPVIIMAGGRGARLLPYTSILPKPLIPIGDYPIAEHIINQFLKYGCVDYYMIVNYKRNMIKAYFDEIKKGYTLKFIEEEKALGTGGGLYLIKGKIDTTFFLTNCDILIEDDLTKAYKQHKELNNMITIICSLKKFTIPYGIVRMEDNGEYKEFHEKPQMSFLVNTGCYIVEAEVLDELDDDQKIDFPELIENLKKKGHKIGVYPISEKAWLDMGQIDELERMKSRITH